MAMSLDKRIRRLMLPGLKRWIAIILFGIVTIVLGVFLLLGYHPVTVMGSFLREILEHAADVLPHRVSGLIVISLGGVLVCVAIAKMTVDVLSAYLPEDRESIPDVLYRRRHLDRGPRVVVVGGGHGLANLLRGLKNFTNNITAVVTVGDDGGSSGRLRQELGVLPPGDIRNCITALADEDKLVTELFQYRFEQGKGLEGHSFGNLFLTALCALTHGDMIQAVKVASRVLNSCGHVLPSTLSVITLVAEMEDGRSVKGESQIPAAGGKIRRMRIEPDSARPTPEAVQAILTADLIVLGPGSLYTSIIPNLLIPEIAEAIRQSEAPKIYVCNVMTQPGETDGYSVSDHLLAVLTHAGCRPEAAPEFVDAVLVNDQAPAVCLESDCRPVQFDGEKLRELGVKAVKRPLVSKELAWHHDANRLARAVMFWYYRNKRRPGRRSRRVDVLLPLRRLASLF
ncbi:MAG TPA: gluconeogenesis factor YvcK family protein [Candidatus Obscuribacterales bacterium]